MTIHRLILAILGVIITTHVLSQDSTASSQHVSARYIDEISLRTDRLQQKLDKKSEKVLQKFQAQENKIRRKLAKKDPAKAATVFAGSEQRYQQLRQQLQGTVSGHTYIPSLDTMNTSLKFLQQNTQWLKSGAGEKANTALQNINKLKSQFSKAEEINKFLKGRRQYLKNQLSNLNLGKEFKELNKQIYYYSTQVNEYKELLRDHTKTQKKAIELLCKTKLFKDFMQKNSQLSSLFRLPGNADDPTAQVSMAGLQTRAQVNNLIQQQVSAGGLGAQQQVRQNLQEAQGQLNQLKNKLGKLSNSNAGDMPDGFKPNDQKTKTFLQRLEFGTNFQSQKSNGLLPVTSDIGVSVGYKLNDKSIIGLGASYKMGWGKDIRHIRISHQGAGLRSFVDWKLKESFWLSGGYEMNYRSVPIAIGISNIDVLKNLSAWQRSGLIGISKVISLKTKFFKKTKLQLLWDFLSYQEVPGTQPILFRVGYNF